LPIRLLIANRGEIALRIIRTCRKLEISTVLVYSDADQNSLPMAYADATFPLVGVTPAETYLSIPKIIRAATETKCDGVHPGYGFLSEDASFARACEEHDLVFIGPSSDSIEKLENKLTARKTMHEAGVPIIPGSNNPLKDEHEAVEVAEIIGFPVILKAAYGGGGRGMRIANSKEEVQRFYRVTKMEAASSFGKSEMYVEKQLTSPRHVEIQALAGKRGNVVILGERECSIQRRHQKLLEEAPSIGISDTTRSALSEAAKKGLEASGYTNAGTVEFLVENTGRFHFLEVNKRIQVEHLVTELTTGIDIVEEQLSIAFESQMNVSQNEIRVRGWAINCRINAEDPRRDFTPSPGTVIQYHAPAGPGIRVDSALYSGYTVPEYYDSLIVKLSAYGRNRKDAIRRMRGALDELEIIGIPTTVPLHQAIMIDKQFNAGDFSTTYLNTFTPKLNEELARLEENAAALAAANRIISIPIKKTLPTHMSDWRRSGRPHIHRPSW
jgi:acetyl-CoA carboxylase biotin carboxylase subunit